MIESPVIVAPTPNRLRPNRWIVLWPTASADRPRGSITALMIRDSTMTTVTNDMAMAANAFHLWE
ncbi:MAG: hypothetical protein GY713_08245 [Actinomycetia bacterium]|nr:hypothetical protein [Actinomycetes bacterium]